MKTKHTAALTKRFLLAMNEIVKEGKQKRGKIKSMRAFALSIGESAQNFQKIVTKGQDVSTSMIMKAHLKYRINCNWLFSGKGEMFLDADVEGRIARLERMIKMK